MPHTVLVQPHLAAFLAFSVSGVLLRPSSSGEFGTVGPHHCSEHDGEHPATEFIKRVQALNNGGTVTY